MVLVLAFAPAACGDSESNPTCDPACDANACMTCIDGACVTSCTVGQTCDGVGTCVADNVCDPACVADDCMVCDNGTCVTSCTVGQTCDGAGTCVDDKVFDPTPLPIGSAEVFRVGLPGRIEVASAVGEIADGELIVVWDRFDEAFSEGELWTSRSSDLINWTAPSALEIGTSTFEASPSILPINNTLWLYFVETDGVYSSPTTGRSHWEGSNWSAPEYLDPIGGIANLLAWPKFAVLLDGRVAVAFRDGASLPKLAISSNGVSFENAHVVSQEGAAMPAVGQFANGKLAFSYQTGSGGLMSSWVRLSEDGATWSDAVRVSESSTNVHDTTLVRRLDGNLDLYYIYPCSGAGFCLHRRCLGSDGALGPEEQVTLPEIGETSKPEALRLSDGRLLLLWATITARSAQGYPSEQVLHGAILAGDAL